MRSAVFFLTHHFEMCIFLYFPDLIQILSLMIAPLWKSNLQKKPRKILETGKFERSRKIYYFNILTWNVKMWISLYFPDLTQQIVETLDPPHESVTHPTYADVCWRMLLTYADVCCCTLDPPHESVTHPTPHPSVGRVMVSLFSLLLCRNIKYWSNVGIIHTSAYVCWRMLVV